jgi:LmbE family N-acetylglucosaminyl deacetylase
MLNVMRLTARWILALTTAALAGIATLVGHTSLNRGGASPLDRTIGPATRLLVIAPHPDDETLGRAGLMDRVMARGGTGRMRSMTSCGRFPERVGTKDGIRRPRPHEYSSYSSLRDGAARGAANSLGVDGRWLSVLGFADEGCGNLASWYRSAKSRAFESPHTDRISPPRTDLVIRSVRESRRVCSSRSRRWWSPRSILGRASAALLDAHLRARSARHAVRTGGDATAPASLPHARWTMAAHCGCRNLQRTEPAGWSPAGGRSMGEPPRADARRGGCQEAGSAPLPQPDARDRWFSAGVRA